MNPRKKSSKLEGRRPFIGIPAAGIICLAFLFNLACDRKTETSQKEVMIEVLDPRGKLVSPEVAGLSNPRINDLNGKKIALMADKPDAILFFNSLEKLLKKAYPTSTILRFPSPASPIEPDNTAEVAAACDVWLEGVKTATSMEIDYDSRLEKLGKPGAAFSVNSLNNLNTEQIAWILSVNVESRDVSGKLDRIKELLDLAIEAYTPEIQEQITLTTRVIASGEMEDYSVGKGDPF